MRTFKTLLTAAVVAATALVPAAEAHGVKAGGLFGWLTGPAVQHDNVQIVRFKSRKHKRGDRDDDDRESSNSSSNSPSNADD